MEGKNNILLIRSREFNYKFNVPKEMKGMTANEMFNYMFQNYSSVLNEDISGEYEIGLNKMTNLMLKLKQHIFDLNNWKNPIKLVMEKTFREIPDVYNFISAMYSYYHGIHSMKFKDFDSVIVNKKGYIF